MRVLAQTTSNRRASCALGLNSLKDGGFPTARLAHFLRAGQDPEQSVRVRSLRWFDRSARPGSTRASRAALA